MALVTRQSISVVFPAYNEAENIEKAVAQATGCLALLFADWQIIVVDDGSTDRTAAIIDDLARADERIAAVHHSKNQGYGAALKSGIQRSTKEMIFFCDSDLQFHLSELLLILTWIEQYDIVAGYRLKRRDPLHRQLNAWAWNRLVWLLLGLKVRDTDCAFKLFRKTVFDAIRIDAVGAMVNTDILVQATRMGFKIKEIPVTHFPRQNGKQTGANIRVILKAFGELFRLHHKLRTIPTVVNQHERRRSSNSMAAVIDRRSAQRRTVLLPINFSDRRRRLVRLNGTAVPLSPRLANSSEAYP